jgi:hypothetical protein
MKNSIFAAALFVTGCLLASSSAPQDLPGGSYSESCTGCAVVGNQTAVTCTCCKKVDGTCNNTSANFGECPGKSLTNNDGALQCGD